MLCRLGKGRPSISGAYHHTWKKCCVVEAKVDHQYPVLTIIHTWQKCCAIEAKVDHQYLVLTIIPDRNVVSLRQRQAINIRCLPSYLAEMLCRLCKGRPSISGAYHHTWQKCCVVQAKVDHQYPVLTIIPGRNDVSLRQRQAINIRCLPSYLAETLCRLCKGRPSISGAYHHTYLAEMLCRLCKGRPSISGAYHHTWQKCCVVEAKVDHQYPVLTIIPGRNVVSSRQRQTINIRCLPSYLAEMMCRLCKGRPSISGAYHHTWQKCCAIEAKVDHQYPVLTIIPGRNVVPSRQRQTINIRYLPSYLEEMLCRLGKGRPSISGAYYHTRQKCCVVQAKVDHQYPVLTIIPGRNVVSSRQRQTINIRCLPSYLAEMLCHRGKGRPSISGTYHHTWQKCCAIEAKVDHQYPVLTIIPGRNVVSSRQRQTINIRCLPSYLEEMLCR